MTEPSVPRRAAGLILGGMAVIGLIDSVVPRIAEAAGLWQFHATRSAMALPLLVGLSLAMGWRLRPRRLWAVAARSGLTATAILLYFGCLAVLPIGVVAAGLFTSPIFVLLISALVLGERVGPRRILAVGLGFAGIVTILQPGSAGFAPVAAVPVLAGALYALGVIGTRRWCAEESPPAMLAAFFLTLGLCGALGAGFVALLPEAWRAGPAGASFVLRPWEAAPGGAFWLWTGVQAVGSLVAVAMLTRAYQTAEPTRVSVFEYSILIFAPLWAFLLAGQALTPAQIAGMGLIAAAGLVLAWPGARRPAGAP